MQVNYSMSTGMQVWKYWGTVHDATLNVITAIKLSDTDNVVVVGTNVNLLIQLSKRSLQSNA